jgi:hypothetical protein
VVNLNTSLLRHLLNLTVAEWIAQIPPHAQQDNFGLKMTPFEWLLRVHEHNVSGEVQGATIASKPRQIKVWGIKTP